MIKNYKLVLAALFLSGSLTLNAQNWPYVVSSGTGVNIGGGNGVSGRELCVVSDQEIYTAMHASSSDQIEVYRYDGISWTMLPSPNASGQLIGNVVSMKKSKLTNDLYIAYPLFNASSYSVIVKKYDGITWAQVGTNLPLASGSSVFGFQLDNNDTPIVLGSKTSSIDNGKVSRLELGVWVHYAIPNSIGAIFDDNMSYVDSANNLIFLWSKTVSINSTPASIDTLAGNTMFATPENINMMFSGLIRLGCDGLGNQTIYNYKTPSAGKIALKIFKEVTSVWTNTATDTLNWNSISCIETSSNGSVLVGTTPVIYRVNDYLSPVFQSSTSVTLFKIRFSDNYAYALLDNGVVRESLSIISSIKDETINKEIALFPNPTNQYIQIQGINFNEGIRVNILSIDGKIMRDEIMNQAIIDVYQLTPGIYFLRLTDKEGKTFTQKFIKE